MVASARPLLRCSLLQVHDSVLPHGLRHSGCSGQVRKHSHCECGDGMHEVGLLSRLAHVGYTVLWYKLEGELKYCQRFNRDAPVFFRFFHYFIHLQAGTRELCICRTSYCSHQEQ